jgi:S-phase kinase-associated protein 1
MLKRSRRNVIMDVSTSDNRYFRLEKEIYEKSKLLTGMWEDCDHSSIFPIPNVNSHILIKIIHYTVNEEVEIQETREDLFSLAIAADYLQMDDLLDNVCKKIADLLKGKSPKEIRSILDIQEPLI